jgi:ribonuclease HI
MKAVLHADGGARGNPGPAGIGVVLVGEDGEVVAEIAEGIGEATNNVAEYSAVIAGLNLALAKGVTDIDVYLDSELVVSQLRGDWKIKNDRLRTLAVRARALLNRFERSSLTHVPRAMNADADRLANQGMDAAMLDREADRATPGQGSFSD